MEEIEKRRLELDAREKRLEVRESSLARLEKQIEKRIDTLKTLRQTIQENLEKEKQVDEANLVRLSKIFQKMKVGQAAERIQNLDRETAVKLLQIMPERSSAKILGKMSRRDAIELSNAIGTTLSEKRKRVRLR